MKSILIKILELTGKTIMIIIGSMLLMNGHVQSQPWSLKQCIDTALLHNRSVELSRLDIAFAREKSSEVKSNLAPKLNAMADYRYYIDQPYQLMPAEAFAGPEGTYKEVQFGTPHSVNANLQLSVPLVNPVLLNSVKTTRNGIQLAEIQKSKTDEEVIMDVAGTYYNAQTLLHQLAFLDSNISNNTKLVQNITLLHQQQMAKGTDVDRLKLQLEQVITQRSTVFSQYQQLLNALKFLMGKPVSGNLQIMMSDASHGSMDFLPRITTEMLLIDKKLELGYTELTGIKSARLPSLNAFGIYGTNGFGASGANSFFNFYPIGYVGAQLTIPIFNGNVTRHKIDQKKIELEKTVIQKEQVNEKTELDRINAEMQYTLANRNVTLTGDQIELATRIYENTILQNQQGLASMTDLLLADAELREAQQNYIVALIHLRKAELEYLRATGNIMTLKN